MMDQFSVPIRYISVPRSGHFPARSSLALTYPLTLDSTNTSARKHKAYSSKWTSQSEYFSQETVRHLEWLVQSLPVGQVKVPNK
jgi:hypothetical protein